MPQAKHACRLCGQTGHRQETCPSIAGQIIRDLKAKLGQRAGKAGKERRLRRVRKDGKLKAHATQSYSGSAQKPKQVCWVRRGDVESLRRLVKDPAKAKSPGSGDRLLLKHKESNADEYNDDIVCHEDDDDDDEDFECYCCYDDEYDDIVYHCDDGDDDDGDDDDGDENDSSSMLL